MGFIYKISNTINDLVYIGQTRGTIEHRFAEHKNTEPNTKLHRAMHELGVNNFYVEELESCSNELLNEREKYWIQEYDSYEHGYNMNRGGAGNYTGRKLYCYTMTGRLFGIYQDFFEAEEITGVSKDIIATAAYNHGLTGGGFQWFFEENKDQVKDLSNLSSNYGKIDVLTLQYDSSGNFIKSYDSIKEASENTGCEASGIARTINGEISYSGGFLWRRGFHGEPIPLKIKGCKVNMRKGKKQVVIKMQNNQEICRYNSLSEAAKKEKISRSKITYCCNIYPRTTCGDIYFKYE